MSVNAKSLGIDTLAIDDKLALIEELWVDVVESSQSRAIPPEVVAKLDSRIAAFEANPSDVVSLKKAMSELREARNG